MSRNYVFNLKRSFFTKKNKQARDKGRNADNYRDSLGSAAKNANPPAFIKSRLPKK